MPGKSSTAQPSRASADVPKWGALAGRVHLFPVRHHSPRTSLVLSAFLDQVRPRWVLVEGPPDANQLIDVLVDPETRPPVAILGYRTDDSPGSVLYPFASYSPEYQALCWAKKNGASARFIDITTGQSLAEDLSPMQDDETREAAAEAERGPDFYEELAERTGHRSFEELWEAGFEAPAYDPASFRRLLIAYADALNARTAGDARRDYHRARDAIMARAIAELVAEGAEPEQVAVVLGAAHAAALASNDVDPALAAKLENSVPSAVTLVPYSFPRLAEQTGYGAGNRAPQFYQRAFDSQGDFRRATLEVLIEFSEHLRLRGFVASLADTIEAYRLACMLSDIRGKSAPGLDELREATIATMCRGEAEHVDGFLWPSVVGKNVGRVSARIGKNSLQDEFWRQVEAYRLPSTDAPESFVLKLGDPVQVTTSVLLHRLRIADIPYANFVGTQAGRGTKDEAGGFAALSRVRESWEAQWTPATDVALVERIVYGDTLQGVCERLLSERLDGAGSTGEAAEVLMEAAVTVAPEALARALDACERNAASDDDLPSLGRACRALSGLVAYGSSREGMSIAHEAIVALCQKTFERAVLRVEPACRGDDEAVVPVKGALRTLHEVALTQPLVEKADWFSAARALLDSYAVNPGCSGLAAGLLYLAGELDEVRVAEVVTQRLSDQLAPERAASFLSGFFEVNALVLVKSRPVVVALDSFITGIDRERFRDTLPLLRRALGGLGATERRYLLENLIAVRKLGEHAGEAAQVMAEQDKEKLAEMSAELADVMDDLDDLL